MKETKDIRCNICYRWFRTEEDKIKHDKIKHPKENETKTRKVR